MPRGAGTGHSNLPCCKPFCKGARLNKTYFLLRRTGCELKGTIKLPISGPIRWREQREDRDTGMSFERMLFGQHEGSLISIAHKFRQTKQVLQTPHEPPAI